MKTLFAALIAATFAFALPAQAQVEIEEAPGAAGASMEPTFFLNTDSARILPANLNVVSLGVGDGRMPYDLVGNFQLGRGFGAGGEFRAHVAYVPFPPTVSGPVPPGTPVNSLPAIAGGLGYKQRVAIAGPFDVAVNLYGAYFAQGFPSQGMPTYGGLLGVPVTAMLGPGDVTFQPRVMMPNLAAGTAGGSYGLTAGYRLPLGPLRLLVEGTAAMTAGGQPAGQAKVGLRYAVLPNLHLDLQGGLDPQLIGTHPGNPEMGLVSGAVRFSL